MINHPVCIEAFERSTITWFRPAVVYQTLPVPERIRYGNNKQHKISAGANPNIMEKDLGMDERAIIQRMTELFQVPHPTCYAQTRMNGDMKVEFNYVDRAEKCHSFVKRISVGRSGYLAVLQYPAPFPTIVRSLDIRHTARYQ